MTDQLKLTIAKRAQAAINSYIHLKDLFNSNAYKTATTQIDNALTI